MEDSTELLQGYIDREEMVPTGWYHTSKTLVVTEDGALRALDVTILSEAEVIIRFDRAPEWDTRDVMNGCSFFGTDVEQPMSINLNNPDAHRV